MDARRARLRDFALSLPGTHEDHPWGETVVKVRRKVFVFLGQQAAGRATAITVKLAESHAHALSVEGSAPTGYGLGKSGWVTVPVNGVPLAVVRDWIEESYRIVAPRQLAAELDRQS